MAKSDRKLTLEEVFNGNISTDYLDIKEKISITERYIHRLAEQRIDLEDKIEVLIGDPECADQLLSTQDKYQKTINKIDKAKQKLDALKLDKEKLIKKKD